MHPKKGPMNQIVRVSFNGMRTDQKLNLWNDTTNESFSDKGEKIVTYSLL